MDARRKDHFNSTLKLVYNNNRHVFSEAFRRPQKLCHQGCVAYFTAPIEKQQYIQLKNEEPVNVRNRHRNLVQHRYKLILYYRQ